VRFCDRTDGDIDTLSNRIADPDLDLRRQPQELA
jgi:hypothetical protein